MSPKIAAVYMAKRQKETEEIDYSEYCIVVPVITIVLIQYQVCIAERALYYQVYSVVVVVVFFTLTDRASTIPSNTCGCQSGTWSAGQKKIRGTSTKLQ